MKQKSLQRITTLLLAMLMLPQAAWALQGSGTASDPYLVEYGAELNTIHIEISQGKWKDGVYIELVNDIVLNSSFKPLGTTGYPFKGEFKGNYHTISGLALNYTTSNQGLFGVTRACRIQDFTITGTMTSSTSGLTNIGSVVGCAQIATIISTVKSSVNININGVAQKHIGGIVGHYEGGVMSPVCGLGKTEYSGVINAGTSTDCIGGIVGFVHADSNPEIVCCNSTGSIYSTGSGPTMGGILGYNNNENNKFSGIQKCFSRCGLHYTGSNKYVSGLAGRIRSNADNITNNCALTDSCGGKLFNTDTDATFSDTNELVTYAQCRSGYVTYKLNPTQDLLSWNQKLNRDNYPYIKPLENTSSFNIVYKIQDKKCTGANYGSAYYSNTNSYTTHHNGSWVERVEPTCTTAGNIRHYHCNDCGKNFSSETSTNETTNITIAALGHDLSSSWSWGNDGHSATCTATCKRSGCTHSAKATATYPNGGITSKVKTAATCYSKGTTTYSAKVLINNAYYTDTKDVQDIAMIAHTLKSTWTWSADGHSAKCTDKCSATGCTHSASATATYPNGGITRSLVSAATCTARASYKYSASLTVNGNKRTNSKTVSEGDLASHNFSGGECTVCHEGDYLTFTATGASTISLVNNNDNAPHVEYSLDDGGTWTTWDYSAISLADGKKVKMRGVNPNGFSNPENLDSNVPYSYFRTTGKIAASGSLMSLIDGHGTQKVIPSKRCFKSLFSSCNLTTAPQLPATTLNEGCYGSMFSYCTSLTTAPVLPGTTLNEDCYGYMFSYCTALTSPPQLPATTLAKDCYSGMFEGCKSLTQAPALPADSLAEDCYGHMFNSCTSLTTAPALPTTKLAKDCYRNMFQGCTSLTTAPALPATTLAEGCYTLMFQGCTSLTTAPALPADSLAVNCYNNMFLNCTSLATAPALPATKLAYGCYCGMFLGCISLVTAPALPADSLAEACYKNMFHSCTSLTTAPELPATKLAKGCYNGMFMGCKSLTTAPKLPADSLAEECYQYMFNGCSKLSKVEVNFTEWSYATYSWLNNVAATGEFICPSSLPQTRGYSYIPEGWTITVKAPAHKTGDVNGDGDVDVVDINCIIDIMLGSTDSPYRNAADVNGDGAVDIVDINCIIQILLGE